MKLFHDDEYKTDDRINLIQNVAKDLKGETELQMGENVVTYDDIKNMYPIQNAEPIKCLVYWDDIMQFTTFGLIEIINSIKHIETTDKMIDFKKFFNRPNEYSNGLAYVFKLYEKVMTKEEIIDIRNKYYWKILEISLKSSVFASMQKTASFFTILGFWFPVRFEHCEDLKIGLKQLLFTKKSMDALRFHYGTEESFHEALSRFHYNGVFTPNIQSTYNYIIEKDLKRIAIFGPEEHNGIDEKTYRIFEKYSRLPMPQYCSLSFYKEQIYK